MVFDPYYKLWLLQSAPSTWVEVTQAYGFQFFDGLNTIARMKATIITGGPTLSSLITSGRHWRITKHDSTNGIDGTPLTPFGHLTGQLEEPEGDERTRSIGGFPVVWKVSGYGMLGSFQRMEYDLLKGWGAADDPATAAIPAGTIISDIRARLALNGHAIVNGTIDTGPSLDAIFRKESALAIALNVAIVGDATKRMYYIMADTDASLNLRLHYLSPANAVFRVTNPFTGPDNARILDQQTEIREGFRLLDESQRVLNAIKVQWAGFHTGKVRTSTSIATDATSVANNGRRERELNAPHLQSATSGGFLLDTTLDAYKGGDGFLFTKLNLPTLKGIGSASMVLKRGELKQASFDAHLGEMVGVQSGGVNQLYGIFAAYAYDGETASLSITIGLPSSSGSGGKSSLDGTSGRDREQDRTHAGANTTVLAGVTSLAPLPVFDSTTTNVTAGNGVFGAWTSLTTFMPLTKTLYDYFLGILSSWNDANDNHDYDFEVRIVQGANIISTMTGGKSRAPTPQTADDTILYNAPYVIQLNVELDPALTYTIQVRASATDGSGFTDRFISYGFLFGFHQHKT